MSSGGGGQSGETRYNWNPVMQGYWAGPDGSPERGFLERAANESMAPYQQYTGSRLAGFNNDQTDAMYGTRNVVRNGTALGNAGREQSRATVEGDYLSGPNANPYAGTQGVGYNLEQGNVGQNEFAGNSPYFKQLMEQGIGDITQGYNKGVGADLRRSANMAGAFGGSGHQAALADAQAGLGKNIANFTSQMGNTQYDRSANLREADIARQGQNSQFNAQMAGMNVDRYNQARQGGASAYENERNRMVGMAPTAMGNDQQAINNYQSLYGMGALDQAQRQRGLDLQYGDWTQAQNWGRNNLGWLASMLGQAQGSTGSTQTFGGYGGVNPAAGLLGAASLYGAMK